MLNYMFSILAALWFLSAFPVAKFDLQRSNVEIEYIFEGML